MLVRGGSQLSSVTSIASGKNSQPKRQPPTCLTLTSHLHFITSLLPIIFSTTASYHLGIHSEIPREYMKVITQQQTSNSRKTSFSQGCSTLFSEQPKTKSPTHSLKKKKCVKCFKANYYSQILTFSLIHFKS